MTGGLFALGGVLLTGILMLISNKQQFNRELKKELFLKRIDSYKEIIKTLDLWETDYFDASVDYKKYAEVVTDNMKIRRAELTKNFVLLSLETYRLFQEFIRDLASIFQTHPTDEEKSSILKSAAKKTLEFKTNFIEHFQDEIRKIVK